MNYKTIKEECEQIKQIYGDDVSIDVNDKYYVCSFKTAIGWFEFLIATGSLEKPYGLEFSALRNANEKVTVKDAITALKEVKYERNAEVYQLDEESK